MNMDTKLQFIKGVRKTMKESIKPIFVDNDNFVRFYKGVKSESFGNRNYVVLYDSLNKKNKELLKGLKKGDFKIEKWDSKKNTISTVLKHVFQKGYNRKKVLNELNDFGNHQILIWLQGMCIFSKELADKVSQIEKYVYSDYFKELLVYQLEGVNCVVRWYKRKL